MTADLQLWRPDRKGTLILSDHRFGGHFLQHVIAERVPGNRAGKFEITGPNQAIGVEPTHDLSQYTTTRFDQCVSQVGYPILLINDVQVKLALLAARPELDQWHKVRLTRRDKTSWFISWWLFIHHQNSMMYASHDEQSAAEQWVGPTTMNDRDLWVSGRKSNTDHWDRLTGVYCGSWRDGTGHYFDEDKRHINLFATKIWELRQSQGSHRFQHHNTSRDVYLRYVDVRGRIPITSSDVYNATVGLADHAVNYSIPVHEELDYENLPALATQQTAWQQNHYPSGRLQDMFENTQQLERLLEIWNRWRPAGLFVPADGNE